MPLDKSWLEYAKILPDARAKRSLREKKSKFLGWMEEIFCVNCGASGGMVTKDWAAHCFYLCNDCVEKHGRVETPDIPESLVRGE